MYKDLNRTGISSIGVKFGIYAFFGILITLLILMVFAKDGDKDYVIVDSLSNIPAPTQTTFTASASETLTICNKSVRLEKLAAYNITGLIVSRVIYNENSEISPVDYVLAWGPFTKPGSKGKISIGTVRANRTAIINMLDYDWVVQNGGEEYLSSCYSNNHLIPATDEIEAKIKKAKIGDYVNITGYLVYAEWEYMGRPIHWGPSSLVRTDDGDGACEIIYVESMDFLKTE